MPLKLGTCTDAGLDAAALDWDALSRLMADELECREKNPLFMVIPEQLDQ